MVFSSTFVTIAAGASADVVATFTAPTGLDPKNVPIYSVSPSLLRVCTPEIELTRSTSFHPGIRSRRERRSLGEVHHSLRGHCR